MFEYVEFQACYNIRMAKHITKITDLDWRGQVFLKAARDKFYGGSEQTVVNAYNANLDRNEAEQKKATVKTGMPTEVK